MTKLGGKCRGLCGKGHFKAFLGDFLGNFGFLTSFWGKDVKKVKQVNTVISADFIGLHVIFMSLSKTAL